MARTRTHTVAKIDRSSRETVQGNGELVALERKPGSGVGFYLPGGHYRIETINGTIDVEAPVWVLFDDEGYPYPVATAVFERTWRAVGPIPA